MYLKALEVTGFKSFGKKAYLEFTAPISAIVGPNGSGKSNIAEAFRFVLGEQSIKSLRGKRGEDLIFNGGKNTPRQNRASVKVIFDNTKRILNIDFDEVTIERAVNRDGTNEYKINGSDVRLKDIVELLFSAHIGSSGHHIISQGEADRMLNSSLKERKAILEEALGLKVYQYKKEEGEKKLQKTEINMKETESLLREIAPHLRFLKKQYEKIEKAEGIKEELVGIYKVYFKTESEYTKQKYKDIDAAMVRTEASFADLKTRRDDLSKKGLGNSEDQSKNDIQKILDPLEDSLRKIISEKDNQTREIGKIEGEISYIGRSIRKFEDNEQAVREIKISIRDIEDLRNEIGGIESIEEIRRKIDAFILKYRNVENISEELTNLREELNKLEVQKAELTEILEKILNDERQAKEHIDEERRKFEASRIESLEAERELMKVESEIHDKEEEIKRMRSERNLLEEEKNILRSDLEEAGMLLGRAVLDFELITATDVANRSAQHERKRNIERLKIRLEEAGVANTLEVMKEYKDTEERDRFLRRELEDLTASKNSLIEMIKELGEKIDVEFKQGVKKINTQFNELFRLMFGGGEARLDVVKEKVRRKKLGDEDLEAAGDDAISENEEQGEEGIDIYVELPHKKIRGLVMLSGGERALTSIALLFAMSQVNPPPFIILDETDAALDEANSKKYGDMIEKLSAHSELILITHNRETMSRAGVIYGVTMGGDGTSKLLSIQFEEAVSVAK
jgi:chromosome segregation ATPase